MGQLLVFQERELCPVWQQAVVTVPAEDAVAGCWCCERKPCQGFLVAQMPLLARQLQLYLYDMSDRFIDRMKVRGYLPGDGVVRVHGPSLSYQLAERAFDAGSPMWADAITRNDPALVLDTVFEMEGAYNPYRDYIMMTQFFRHEERLRSSLPEVIS